jgi:hypothetical protein
MSLLAMNESEKDSMLKALHAKAHKQAQKKVGAVFKDIRKTLREIGINGGDYELVIQTTGPADDNPTVARVALWPMFYSLEALALEKVTEQCALAILANAAATNDEGSEKTTTPKPQRKPRWKIGPE